MLRMRRMMTLLGVGCMYIHCFNIQFLIFKDYLYYTTSVPFMCIAYIDMILYIHIINNRILTTTLLQWEWRMGNRLEPEQLSVQHDNHHLCRNTPLIRCLRCCYCFMQHAIQCVSILVKRQKRVDLSQFRLFSGRKIGPFPSDVYLTVRRTQRQENVN